MRYLVQFNAMVDSAVSLMLIIGKAECECDAHASWSQWARNQGFVVAYEKLGPDALFLLPSFMRQWSDHHVLEHYQNFDLGDVRRNAYNNLPAGEKFHHWSEACRLTAPEADFLQDTRVVSAKERSGWRLPRKFFDLGAQVAAQLPGQPGLSV
jgi:hypothetical protein